MGVSDVMLQIENLKTYYFTRKAVVPAVDGINLRIRRGEIVGLVGESGSGKSQTALSILQLVPTPGRIVEGRILFDGEDLLQKPEREMERIRGARIAIVLQDPMTSLNPVLTVGNQVAEPVRYHRDRVRLTHSVKERVIQLLRSVQIPAAEQRLRDYPIQFSGGMRQRVSIAMGTGCHPELLIADEPTTALDVTIQAQIVQLLLDLKERLGMSILFITHDFGIVAETCDTVAVMYAGKIVEYNEVQRIFAQPQHPYTQALLRSLPRLGVRVRQLPSIDGQPPALDSLPGGCSFWPRCPHSEERCRIEYPPSFPAAGASGDAYVRCWLASAERAITPGGRTLAEGHTE